MTKEELKKQKKELKQEYITYKKAYKGKVKSLKEEYIKTLEENNQINVPHRSVLEEVGNSVTHGVGSVFSIVALILMLLKQSSKIELISALIYFFGMFFLFTMSTLYHSFKYGLKVKTIFRRFDYSSIYLLIGSTFAPILLVYIGGKLGLILFIIQWVIIITGIVFICVFGPHKLRYVHIPLYLILGWSALMFIPKMVTNDLGLFIFVLLGGIIYTLGIIPFAIKKKSAHFIWHFFVLFGCVVQWIGIYLYIF